jgi:hypothetical protein
VRKPNYLSYSALSLFESDLDEYCLRYLVDERPPRETQGVPAGVGSAFDARVKSTLYDYSYGKGYKPELYSYEVLFEKQVEPPNRDVCGPAGDHVFACYKLSGFLDRIKALAAKVIEPPQYEFSVEKNIGGVQLLGKPDGLLRLPDVNVVLDWKVNGYCSNTTVSPNQGYILCRDGYIALKQSKSHDTAHKNVTNTIYRGVTIGGHLEDSSEPWASQLAGYAWCLGEPVGSENVVFMIHQCVAKPIPETRPLLRFAEFCGPVRKPYQEFLLTRYQKCWAAIQNEHIFHDLSLEESRKRFNMMNAQAKAMVADGGDSIWVQLVRPTWRGK